MAYTITFEDGTEFVGGSPADSKWDSIPKKPIKQLEYRLTPMIGYLFKDFDAYNHLVERVKTVNASGELITKLVVMGAVANRVYQIILDSQGNVFRTVVGAGKEYSPSCKLEDGKFAGWNNPKPLTVGWKTGAQRPKGVEPRLELVGVE